MRDQGQEWKYVVILEQKDNGCAKMQCCFCEKTFTGGAVRIRDHLFRETGTKSQVKTCDKVPSEVVELFEKISKERQDLKIQKRKKEALDEATSTSKFARANDKQQSLVAMFSNKDLVDSSLARGFYSAGIPFNVINNSHFRHALTDIARFGAGFTPPSEYSMRTSLLAKEVKRIDTEMKSTVLADLNVMGGTLVSDGWSNVKSKPLLNFLLVCPKGEVFLDSVDTSGEDKTSQFVADSILRQINAVGSSNVIQVITDSASNCKGSWPIITAACPHVTCGPCAAHCLDLLLEDLQKIDWIKKHFKEGRETVNFITSHHKSLALFRQHSQLQLLKPNDTRFCTEFVSHSRLLEVKDSLQETVVDKIYKTWLQNKCYRLTGIEITARILDESWWKTAGVLVQLCKPIVALLRLVDGGVANPAIGKVYFRMFEIVQHVSATADVTEQDRHMITGFVNDRWKMLHTDMHSAGFVLDPEYNFEGYAQSTNEEVMTGLCNILEKFYPENVDKQGVALQQLGQFRRGNGIFSRDMVKNAAKKMAAHTWWSTFGGGVPELQTVAIKVLAQVCCVYL